jgi:hypothetical protein
LFISFVPGFDGEWFGVAAILAALGLLSPSWRVRALGLALALGMAWFAWLGYQNGLRYQEWLRERGLA